MDNVSKTSEFSRIYTFNAIKQAKQKEVSLKASTEECAALAKRIQVSRINEFIVNAVIGITDEPNVIHAIGVLSAKIKQAGDTKEQDLSCPIDVFFKPESEIELNAEISIDELDIEPYENGCIDFGEICAQYLSLALMPFPTVDDFNEEFVEVYSEPKDTPFAELERLKS